MRFDAEKVTEAAALLLDLRGGRMHYIKLLKLLYIADRQAFAEWGIPISHDNYVSMDNGPVLSQTYNLVKEGGRFWSQHISAPFADSEVELLGAPPKGKKLSVAEENLLRRIFDMHGRKNRWDIVDYVHKFPEWRDPHGSSLPIGVGEILQALKVPDGKAILAELEHERRVEDRLEAFCT
ncbi:MAG TPA: Panacea domain-containing protein [Acidisarcina sp.]